MFVLAGVVSLSVTRASAETLAVSTWGGSFRDLIEQTIAKKFTAETGVKVEYVTGGTIDRLNDARLDEGDPSSDVTFTTSHIGWLYADNGLFEKLDFSKIPNAEHLVAQARISPYHIGVWAYVYSIAYRPSMIPPGFRFESWNDLWSPKLKGLVSAPDFDPSHLIAVACKLDGVNIADWRQATPKLLALLPNFKAFYTNDANGEQMLSTGESPVAIMLSMNAYHMKAEGAAIDFVIPREGAVLGVDTIAINKGSRKVDLAYKFINIALDVLVQTKITEMKKSSPVVEGVVLPEKLKSVPGILTSPQEWQQQTIIIPDRLRARDIAEWRAWFAENMISR
ncbi:MAG: ABC transporter substrate-binding protein [Acetobacter sp.]|uniref:ABC transporter substrate-binding protein n=1 Tax=Acetobacter sp. TaxID=440 RepID=UPI0039E86D82